VAYRMRRPCGTGQMESWYRSTSRAKHGSDIRVCQTAISQGIEFGGNQLLNYLASSLDENNRPFTTVRRARLFY
jgi:hypothetical protein